MKAAAGVVMTVDNNKTLLTKVSAWFIINEVYTMRKITVKATPIENVVSHPPPASCLSIHTEWSLLSLFL